MNKPYYELESIKGGLKEMANETVEKAKADVKKGIAEVGKAAANLSDDVRADVEKVKAKFVHNADVEKKADATRILITEADSGARSDSEKKNVDGNSDTKKEAKDMVPFQQDLYDDVQADANAYTKDARNLIEQIFGVNAGIVWKALNLSGPMTIDDIVKSTALNSEEIYGALGWLGRENKISLEIRAEVRFFSLRQ